LPPNIVCSGRAGAFAPPERIQPRKVGSGFGFFPPNPPPAAKTNRSAASPTNQVKSGIFIVYKKEFQNE